MQEDAHANEQITNIKFCGVYGLMHNRNIVPRSMQELVRIIDAKHYEIEHAKKKLEHKLDFIDIEARNVFTTKEVTPSIMKCAYEFNHYGLRDTLINNEMVETQCPRCNFAET